MVPLVDMVKFTFWKWFLRKHSVLASLVACGGFVWVLADLPKGYKCVTRN